MLRGKRYALVAFPYQTSIEHKLLKSVVLSFAHKLYVERTFSFEDNK